MQVKLLWKKTVNILVKLVSNDPHLYYKLNTALSWAVIKTVSGEWHQTKMMVTCYLKQSFIQNKSLQKCSKLHETIITRSAKGKKPMSPVLLMCKCRQTFIIIVIFQRSFKDSELPELSDNKFTFLRTTWNDWSMYYVFSTKK